MAFLHTVCVTVLFLGLVNSVSLPDIKCKLDDAECLKGAAQQYNPTFALGIPELGTDPLDVMELDEIDFNLSGLQFNLKDGRLKGLKNAVIDKLKWDPKKKRLDLVFHANCTIRGHYKASGRILILPITGDGNMKLKLRNLVVNYRIDAEIVKDEAGKDRLQPKKYLFDYDVVDNANFDLTNLFNGNKELSDPMLVFLNQNWKQISIEFGTPMMDVAAKILFKNIAKFLSQLPLEDIAIV